MITSNTPKDGSNLTKIEDKIQNLNLDDQKKEGEFKDELALKRRSLEDLTKQDETNNRVSSYLRGVTYYSSFGFVSHTNVDRFEEFQSWVKENFGILIDREAKYSDPLLKALQKFCLSQVNATEKELNHFLDLEGKVGNMKLEELSKEYLNDWGKVVLDLFLDNKSKSEINAYNKEIDLSPFGKAVFERIAKGEGLKNVGDAVKGVPIKDMLNDLKPFTSILNKKIGERILEKGEKLAHPYQLYVELEVESKRGLDEHFYDYIKKNENLDLSSMIEKYVDSKMGEVESYVIQKLSSCYRGKEEAMKVLQYMKDKELTFQDIRYEDENGKKIYLPVSCMELLRSDFSQILGLKDPHSWNEYLGKALLEKAKLENVGSACEAYIKDNFLDISLFNTFFEKYVDGKENFNIADAGGLFLKEMIEKAKNEFNIQKVIEDEKKIVEDEEMKENKEDMKELLLLTN